MKVGGGLDHDDEEAAHSGAGCAEAGAHPLVITPTCPSTARHPHTTFPLSGRGVIADWTHGGSCCCAGCHHVLLAPFICWTWPFPLGREGDHHAVRTTFRVEPEPTHLHGTLSAAWRVRPLRSSWGTEVKALGGVSTKSPHHSREQSVSSGVHVLDSARVALSADRNVIDSFVRTDYASCRCDDGRG